MTSATRRAFYAGPAGVPRDSRRGSARLLFLSILVLGALLSLLYVRQTNDLASAGYDVADLQSQEIQWKMRNDQLRLQIADLKSLDRIDRVASGRLGMGPPSRVVYVVATPVSLPTPRLIPTPTAVASGSPLSALLRSVSGAR